MNLFFSITSNILAKERVKTVFLHPWENSFRQAWSLSGAQMSSIVGQPELDLTPPIISSANLDLTQTLCGRSCALTYTKEVIQKARLMWEMKDIKYPKCTKSIAQILGLQLGPLPT